MLPVIFYTRSAKYNQLENQMPWSDIETTLKNAFFFEN